MAWPQGPSGSGRSGRGFPATVQPIDVSPLPFFLDELRTGLGARARRIGVLGAPELAARLRDSDTLSLAAPAPGAALDGLVWCLPQDAVFTHRDACSARRALAPAGRLVVRQRLAITGGARPDKPPDEALAPQIQQPVLALLGAGFALLDERWLADGSAQLVARSARCEVRAYQAGDEHAIAPLFARSFHRERSLAAWRWKFLEHPWRAPQPAISLAWDDDRLVGQYAAVPMRMVWVGGADVAALQLCDIMTAASVRHVGRGKTAVLSRMLRHLYAGHGEQRVGFVLGFITGTSRAFALRFSAGHELEPVACWRRAWGASPRLRGGGYRVREVAHFGTAFDHFFARVAPAYGFLQRRDARYLAWRYRQPDVAYRKLAALRFGRLVGWSVFQRQGPCLVWGDALIDPRHPRAAAALLASAFAGTHADGCREVRAWFSERPVWWQERLAALGFERTVEADDLSIVYGVHSQPDTARMLRELYYTQGDSDLF